MLADIDTEKTIVSAEVPVSLAARVIATARAEDRSRSSVIRRALENYFGVAASPTEAQPDAAATSAAITEVNNVSA